MDKKLNTKTRYAINTYRLCVIVVYIVSSLKMMIMNFDRIHS